MKKILLIFKDRKKITKNHEFWYDKLSLKYDVEMIFLEEYLHLTNLKIIRFINSKVKSERIDYTIFEGDHVDIIDKTFIDSITNETLKGLFLGDDNEWHEVNRINSAGCDFIFTSCPISTLKFNECGIQALFVPIEANGRIWKNFNLPKDIDVLFFGREKKIRNKYFDVLEKRNINILKVDPYQEISNTNEKLAKLINRSKIVLNFSASSKSKRFWTRLNMFDYFYHFKGRILMTSFCNSLCITEYDPAASMIFDEQELPQFETINECADLVQDFLNDEQKLKNFTKRFHEKGKHYLDENYIMQIENFLSKNKIRKKNKFHLDFWYVFIHIKQIYRSRFKNNNFITIFKQCLENFFLYRHYKFLNYLSLNFLSLLFFFRFLPFIPVKIIKNLINKKN